MTSTLRGRLTLWHLAILAASLGLFAALGYGVVSWNLYGHHDEELLHQAEHLTDALDGVLLDQTAMQQAIAGTPVGTRFVMVRNRRGDLIYRDPVLDSSEPNIGHEQALVHAVTMEPREPVFFTTELERSAAVRFICVPLSHPDAYLQVGDPLGDIETVLDDIALAWLPLFPIVLFLSSFGGWLIARRALSPMDTVTTTLEDIQATNLSRRIDVTTADAEVHDLVATLNGLLDRLERAFDSLRQFAGDVSHQIQTPLTVITGALDAAGRQPDRAREPEWLDTIREEIGEIRDIVTALRTLALADAPVRDAGQVDLSQVVAEAADIIGALGEPQGVAVRTDITPGLVVRGDQTRLKQVILNLGDNAVKYTPSGGDVTITLRAVDDTAVLSVRDTGIGIPDEHLPRLFDRLFRAEAAGRRAAGTGLGLAIVKRILDAHGGQIEVTSTPGQGSTFVVTLPR